jgi:alpha-L-rhamnosidase
VRSATAEVEATDNWARLGVASASSTHSRFSVAAVNDGRVEAQTDYEVWNAGNGWNDATSRAFPDTLQVAWSESTPIGRVVLRTVDSPTQTAAVAGVSDYDVEVRSGGEWTVVDQIRGSTAATVTSSFAGRDADAVRVTVLDSNDHTYSRVVELEAYSP